MNKPQSEQRGTRRFSLRLPMAVKLKSQKQSDVSSQTTDVSARGVFFQMDPKAFAVEEATMTEGSPLEFTLTLPPEITLTEAITVHCKGRVVRVQKDAAGVRVGIAAAIDQYDIAATPVPPADPKSSS